MVTVSRPYDVPNEESRSSSNLLGVTMISSIVLGLITGALVLFSIPVSTNVVLAMGLVSVCLLFITSIIFLSMALHESR